MNGLIKPTVIYPERREGASVLRTRECTRIPIVWLYHMTVQLAVDGHPGSSGQ